jgi:hypothetical protein
MKLKQTLDSMVDQSQVNQESLLLGTIISVNHSKEVAVVQVEKNNEFKLLHNVAFPRGSNIKEKYLCVVGYLGGSSILPVILSTYSESLLYTVSRPEDIPDYGPLFIEEF